MAIWRCISLPGRRGNVEGERAEKHGPLSYQAFKLMHQGQFK